MRTVGPCAGSGTRERRASLVDSTIRAIRRYGAVWAWTTSRPRRARARPSSTDTSRTGPGCTETVVERVDERVVGDVVAALKRSSATGTDPRELISSTVGAYLGLVESDTDLYRFVVNRPMVDRPLKDDPVGATVGHVTDSSPGCSRRRPRTTTSPRRRGESDVALVGAVQAVADEWRASPVRVPRAELVESLTEFVWRPRARPVAEAS